MTRHLRRIIAAASAMLGTLPAIGLAQQGTTISGRVTSDAAAPLPGVSVSIPTLGAGAYTDAQGHYSFSVPSTRAAGQTVTLSARRIGYTAKNVTITLSGASITQDFTLGASATQLTGVVVTALGIQKEKSQLGTAQQEITPSQLNSTRSTSIVDQMQGKVSGVQITGSGTQGGSSNIVIRGQNSITGNNTPLFVVDGVAISNAGPTGHSGSANGSWDFGTAISDINPEDIESMSVLKGPNAAALYGSRATNGVVVITTKKGRNTGSRARVDASQVFTFDTPSRLWDYQNMYGQGAGGEFMYVDGRGGGVNDGLDQSFGPKADGRTHGCTFIDNTTKYDQTAPCLQFTSPNAASPFIAYPNNVKDFFQVGRTSSSNISVTGGSDRASARLSLGSDNVNGIIPDNFLQKTSGVLNGTLQVNDKLSTNATLQYVRNTGRNRPGVGYNIGILEQFIWFGRSVDVNALKNYNLGGASNNGPSTREYNWNYNFHNNPWWLQGANPEYDARDRFIASAAANYKVTDWLNASLSTGSDIYRYNIDQRFGQGNISNADPSYSGGFDFFNEYRNENSTQLLLTANKAVTSRITLNGTAGGSLRNEQYNNNESQTKGISVAGIYNVSNAAISPTATQQVTRRQVNGVYGSASATWDGWWTVEGTARNDWSSTLPVGQNSYFYPSVNSSVLLSDALPGIKKGGLSFLKLRGSYARVGADAPPYRLATIYNGNPNKFNGLPQFSLDNTIANPYLKPEITTSAEGGVEAGWLDGRLTLDASYYGKSTRDQIFNITISPTNGYSSKAINAGRIDNKGFEALLTVIPVRLSNGFEWTSTLNYSHNQSRVVSLSPGIKTIVLGTTWSTNAEAREGEPYGAIYGNSFLRDSATGQLIVSGGVTQPGPLKVLGNQQPKWVGSFNNTFTYKNLSLNMLFDARRGGQVFSVSNWFGVQAGVTKESLMGREVNWDNPGVVVKGLDKSSCTTGSHTAANGTYVCVNGKQNTTNVTSEEYFTSLYPVVEPAIYTNNWVKLRELRVGFDLPTRFANRIRMSSANVSFIGRNLWMSSSIPNIDPEFSYSTGNAGQFAEFAALPNARSVGLTLRVTP